MSTACYVNNLSVYVERRDKRYACVDGYTVNYIISKWVRTDGLNWLLTNSSLSMDV
jgi:hypothetical protein